MSPGHSAQLRRQGEGGHEVIDGQQLGALALQPVSGLLILAARAASMAARQRLIMMLVAVVTRPVDLSGLRGSAAQHRVHGASVSGEQTVAVALFKLAAVLVDDRGQFHDHNLCRSTCSRSTSWLMMRKLSCSVVRVSCA